MKLSIVLLFGAVFLVAGGTLRAAAPSPAEPERTDKATALLRRLQADISAVPTTSLASLAPLRTMPITGRSLREGWSTYYRYGDVRFRSRDGLGYDIMPELDSIAVLRPDSLYLGLTVASKSDPIAANRSFDLAPYMPGCRLYVFYRENFVGQFYQNEVRPTTTERRIYRVVEKDLAAFGIPPR